MFRLSRRVATILLLLGLVLVAPWPAEAAGGTGAAWVQTWELAVQIWKAWAGLWDEGCSLDPSGVCGSGSQAKNGCSVDPNGRSVGSTAEEGCSVDPNGRRTCGPGGSGTASLNNGCSLDPNGVCRE